MSERQRVVLLVVAPLLVACGPTPPLPTAAPPSSTAGTPTVSRAVPHALYTHCGIWETRFDGQYWATSPTLPDQTGSAPDGWDDPLQHGTMRRLSATEAQFRDENGHVVMFLLRPGARGFQRVCA